ncbi:hypothetical protein HDU92_003039 [Lobulomyces angularis]|nr:hypothetical protein HDU92_003039 [Lobulomyces angularis]
MGVDPNEKSEIQGSRGEAMLVVKCKFCKKSGNCDLELENLGLTCEGEGSGTKFDIDFSDGDWADYDEKNSESVSMSEIETCISKKK